MKIIYLSCYCQALWRHIFSYSRVIARPKGDKNHRNIARPYGGTLLFYVPPLSFSILCWVPGLMAAKLLSLSTKVSILHNRRRDLISKKNQCDKLGICISGKDMTENRTNAFFDPYVLNVHTWYEYTFYSGYWNTVEGNPCAIPEIIGNQFCNF